MAEWAARILPAAATLPISPSISVHSVVTATALYPTATRR